MSKRIPGYKKDMLSKIRQPFTNIENIERNYSQAWQDMFILTVLNGKRNGTYLEIGAQHPLIKNNTYILEKLYKWKGISIDINPAYNFSWKNNRSNHLLITDATTVNYSTLLTRYSMPKHIDYLQLDTEPPKTTYKVLTKIPWDKYRFSVITYEHDLYSCSDAIKYQNLSRKHFMSLGYTMVVGNVCNTPGKPFEDWWVANEDVKDLKIIEDFNLPSGYYFLNV